MNATTLIKAARKMKKIAQDNSRDGKSDAGVMDKIDGFYDRHNVLAPIVSGTIGYKMVSDPRSISKLTGTEHLFHGTLKSNIPGIMDKGLLVQKSYDPNTISHKHGLEGLAKGLVFTGRTMKPINQMNFIQQATKYRDASPADRLKSIFLKNDVGTVKIRIPYKDLRGLNPGIDPVWTRASEGKGLVRMITRYLNKNFGPDHTMTFTKDVSPEYIKGSPKFKHGLLAELKGIPSYAAKNPLRFMAGAGKVGAGAGMLGLTARQLYRQIMKHRSGDGEK